MVHVQLITLNGKSFDDRVYEIMIPTQAGQIAVYEGHAPLLGVGAPGIVAIRPSKNIKDDERDFFAIYGGTIEVLNNTVRILVDEADTTEDVVQAETEKALERAKHAITEAKDHVSLSEAQAMMDRQAVRLRLAELRKRSKKNY